VFPNPEAEAAAVASLLREKKNGAGIVVADSGLLPELESAAGDCGVNAFSPGGRPLSLSEAGRVTLLWMDWRAGGSFFTLRHLLELPSFQAWLCARAVSFGTHRELLHIVEFLTVTCLATNLSSASLLLREKVTGFHREEMELRKRARELVDELENISQLDVDGLLGELYPDAGADDPVSAILNLLVQLRASGLLEAAADKEEMTRRLLRRALAREKTHAPAPPDAVVLHGWLEAPWLEVQDLHIAGCQDAVLPGIKRGHAFLPDVARAELQLATQATRRARDAYLLQALCSSRAGPEFRCSFSQKGADGSPALPSSLLLRCEPDALPQRVKNLFAAAAGPVRPRRRTNWKWELPADWHKGAPKKISPTDFSQYLRCPVRFYFSRVLGAEAFDPEAREMDARQFGTLVHDALEHFAIHDPDLEFEKDIADCLLDTLEQRARRMFGSGPGGAVLVQLEAIRVRLRSFARLQARERAEGWRILAAERKLSSDEEQPFCINGLPLSAKIDRIDRHEDGTLRILDYKTTAKPKKPVETHFAPAGRSSHVRAAQVCVEGKEKTWADLQLPLYRLIAGRWYPECERIEVAYVVLPADPAHTALVGLPLDAGLLASAVECADEVAGHVKRGHFWPPQPWPAGWEDPLGPLLVNGRPEDCFGAETISFLKGEE
jgi:ATP-dependent helicase/nuclease subunit B